MKGGLQSTTCFESISDPIQAGMSEKNLMETKGWLDRQTGGTPYGCLILRHGSIVVEWYEGGFLARSLFEIGSIRKSFNSALIGIGIKDGKVNLNARAVDWWPEIITISGDEADAAITLHQLASGVSGWMTPDPPGRMFLYSNAGFTAAERVVARMYGLPNDEIAPEVVKRFKTPLKADSWHVYHFGRDFTAGNIGNPGPKLAIDSNLRDLVKWGYLWLRKGVWDGRELVPSDYADLATRQVNPRIPNAYYGYNWYVNARKALWPDAPEDSYGHPGSGTFKPSWRKSFAYVWICPSLDIVAAIVFDQSVGFIQDFRHQEGTFEWVRKIVNSVCQ